ncbi:MAG: nucleotide pyrophosphohydrolase [Gemmatimonadaceae bacterium]
MSDSSIEALRQKVRAFADARDWAQFHDPKNLAMALGSEVGELLSILRWVPGSVSDEYSRDATNGQRILEELGDIGILLVLLCDRVGTSLDAAILAKLKLNEGKYPQQPSTGRSDPPAM